ncbi:hypothetical protein ACRRTK_019256 [Alexandromys fortis]
MSNGTGKESVQEFHDEVWPSSHLTPQISAGQCLEPPLQTSQAFSTLCRWAWTHLVPTPPWFHSLVQVTA